MKVPTFVFQGMVCEKGIQILLTTVGAFAAFGLMTVAIGTDYWLYSRALICNSTANVSQDDPHNKDKKDPGALTHSGLWRICCLEGTVKMLHAIGGNECFGCLGEGARQPNLSRLQTNFLHLCASPGFFVGAPAQNVGVPKFSTASHSTMQC